MTQSLPSNDAVRQQVRRVRKTSEPRQVPVDELVLDGEFAETLEDQPQQFLIYDNSQPGRRLIIFASQKCLKYVSEGTQWFLDGNFSLAPAGFQQLYIIRVALQTTAITAVFALMQSRDVDAYSELFNVIKDTCERRHLTIPTPETVNCDFESAAINAINVCYPDATVQGCFYHLTQVTYSNITII